MARVLARILPTLVAGALVTATVAVAPPPAVAAEGDQLDLVSSTITMTGATATATNLSWNSRIPPGQAITIGFNGAKPEGAEAAVPASFELNGGECDLALQ